MREDSTIVIADPDAPHTIQVRMVQCVHCGGHFPAKPVGVNGTKWLTPWEAEYLEGQDQVVRGFCLKCNGPLCSARCAKECIPIERQLENLEHGKAADTPSTTISVPSIWLP